MKIVFDGLSLAIREGTGLSTYARNLLSVATAVGHETHLLYGRRAKSRRSQLATEADFFGPEPTSRRRIRRLAGNFIRFFTTTPYAIPRTGHVDIAGSEGDIAAADHLWNATALYEVATNWFSLTGRFLSVPNVMNAHVAHWTFPMPIRLENAQNVYTVHDLIPLKLPFATLQNRQEYFDLIENIIKLSDRLVTVSESSKSDLTKMFSAEPKNIANCYQSINIPREYLDLSDSVISSGLRNSFGLTFQNYVLWYGAIEPKKNLLRLIDAFAESQLKIPLVIVGKDGWLNDRELMKIKASDPWVKRIPFVSFRQLIALIRGARLLAFPSLDEGFGLPILEAMTCGTPVLTTDRGATRELAGDAALLVDPHDVGAMGRGLARLAGDEQLRADLTRKGLERVRNFSPRHFADRVNAVYLGLPGAEATGGGWDAKKAPLSGAPEPSDAA